MAKPIRTPKTETKTVSTVDITSSEHNYEQGTLTISYMTLLDDGTPYQRGSLQINNPTEIAAVYTAIGDKVVAGDAADVAMDAVAYDKVLDHLG